MNFTHMSDDKNNMEDKFELLKSGSNSRIYRYGNDQSAVILKAVPIQCQKQTKHMINEYKILKKISHPNIVNVLKYKQNLKLEKIEENSSFGLCNVIVMQSATQGNLLDFYKRNYKYLTIPQIRYIFLSIANGIEYLHSNFIVHRDLKLQNILVFQSQEIFNLLNIKLADFGFAQNIFIQNQQQGNIKKFNNFKGTKRGYMAPQIHQCTKSTSSCYDARKCDIFALGVILFSLILGKLPFQFANRQNKLYNLISQKKYEQFWLNHSKELQKLNLQEYSMIEQFKELFQKMVAYNCQQRHTIEQILKHHWLSNGQVKQIRKNNDYQ